MDLRVTSQSIMQQALSGTRDITSQLAALQTQASTGQKYANVSDNPSAALTILSSTAQNDRLTADLGNITAATSALNLGVSTLQQVGSVFSDAHSIALQAANSTNDANSMEAMAQQVDGMINQLLALANTQNNQSYIFAGTASSTQPFVVTQQDAQGRPLTVSYQGDNNTVQANVDINQQVAMYYPGNSVFMQQQRQPTVFTGNTGAQPGAGTDTDTSQQTLVLTHTSTTFAPGSGVQPGTSSAAGDTILGTAGQHQIHITDTSGTGAAGTISLDGGPTFNFTNTDNNLKISNGTGDTLYVNTTAITPNFDGDVAITANGTLSIDGGATATPINFTAGQTVTNSSDGKATFVDTTNVARTGTEQVVYPGTANAFQSLIALRDDLRNTQNLPANQQLAAISQQADDLQRVSNNVLKTVGVQSSSLSTMQSLQSHLSDLQLAAQKNISDVGGADVADVVVKMQSYTQMLQLTLATFAQISNVSLLDYLQ